MEKAKVYKVYCEYLVKANSRKEVIDFIIADMSSGEFYEKHIIIDETGVAGTLLEREKFRKEHEVNEAVDIDYDLTK